MTAGLFPRQGQQLRSQSNHQIKRITPLNFPLTLGQLRRHGNDDTTLKNQPSEGSYGRRPYPF